MCKLTKNLPVQEVVGFSEFRGEDLTSGEGKNFGGLRPPLHWSYALGHLK